MTTTSDTQRELPAVKGFCPLGHGETLHLLDDGTIACTADGCARPCMVTEIITEPDTGHIVTITGRGFEIVDSHPLGEFLTGCELRPHLTSLHGPPVQPGTYRALCTGGIWTFGTSLEVPPAAAESPVYTTAAEASPYLP